MTDAFDELGKKDIFDDLSLEQEASKKIANISPGAMFGVTPFASSGKQVLAPGRKTLVEAAEHGYRQAGVQSVKAVSGLARAVGESNLSYQPSPYNLSGYAPDDPFAKEYKSMKQLAEWGSEMSKAADLYLKEHPEEAMQFEESGFLPRLKEFFTKPELIVQGAIESLPIILEGTLGSTVAGPAGGIVAMTPHLVGQSYNEAREAGANPGTALAQAIITGPIEAAIEEWPLAKALGLTKLFAEPVRRGTRKVAWEGVKAFFRGMAEEGSQEFNRNFWHWVFTDRSQKWTANIAEAMAAGGPLEMALAGAFSGVGMVGRGINRSQKINRVEKMRQQLAGKARPVAKAKAKQSWEMDINEYAESVKDKMWADDPRMVRMNHMGSVENAIKKGESVPIEILQEYSGQPWAIEALETAKEADQIMSEVNQILDQVVEDINAGMYDDPHVAVQIAEAHNESGRSSTNLRTREKLTKGYAVSPYPERTVEITGKEVSAQDVNNFMAANKDILGTNPDAIVGTWYNGDNDTTYLDVSIVKSRKRDAIKLAKDKDQLAIFDLKKMEDITVPRNTKIGRKNLLKKAHILASELDWSETQRRDFMEAKVGKRSMKDMDKKELQTVTDAIEYEAAKKNIVYSEKSIPTEEMIARLNERNKQPSGETPIGKVNRRGVFRLLQQLKGGAHGMYYTLYRVERFLESLDGHEDGPIRKHIWEPVKDATEMATEETNQRFQEFMGALESEGIDAAIWLGKEDSIPGVRDKLTAAQRIGIYCLAQNKKGYNRLVKGMGLTKEEISAINEFMTPQEKSVAEWMLSRLEAQWPAVKSAALKAGIDPDTLHQELRYFPLSATDVDLSEQHDFLSDLAGTFRTETFMPPKGVIIKRKKGASGPIEIDAFVLYVHNIMRASQFRHMAPVAKDVGKVLNNRSFKEALNNATYGQGSKILNKWMQDSVLGHVSRATTAVGKSVSIMRRNAIVYAIAYNIPSALRQNLSMWNAIAVDPLMLKYTPANLLLASTGGYDNMQEFVHDRSLEVKNRSWERDMRQKWDRKAIKQKLRGKAPWSKRATKWIQWMDRHTVVVVWKSLYDTAMEKNGGDEVAAAKYADKWVGRTQPMADPKDLPDFFRGGQLEQLLSTFQNQVNNNGNFYAHDIVGAKRAGEIGMRMVGYRAMFSWILPALLFGAIGRGRLPKEGKEIAVDLTTYPIAPLILVGRMVDRMIRGWGQSGTLPEIAPEEIVQTVSSARRGDIKGVIKNAAQAVGSATGRIPAQAIRTTEGILDLAAGKTDDPRRLIYSEWALNQGESKKKKRRRSR